MPKHPHPLSRKIILIFQFILLISASAVAQNGKVTGVVLDAKTGEPLPFANVFVNNTTLGKATDLEGKFRMDALPYGKTEIVASFVGYIAQYKTVVLREGKELSLTFNLKPLEKELEGVELTARRDKKWERQLNRFTREFLGEDHMASDTEILNPWVLNFENGKDEGSLPYFAALADEPLEIVNNALGYQINYYLKEFKQTRRELHFEGLVQYTEMTTSDQQLADLWHTNRQRVYLGSTRHLFKAMINNDLAAQGFELYQQMVGFRNHVRTNNFRKEIGNTVELYTRDPMAKPGRRIGEYELFSTRPLEVHYVRAKASNDYYVDAYYPLSWLIFKDGSIDVTAKGVELDPSDLVVSGHMAKVRVAHMLPHNFNPDESINTYEPSTFMVAEAPSKWLNLLEKPYLHTDKPYYYPGETIWMKGYMIYENPLMADTLSRVLYVDLISPQKEIVQSHSFPIEAGETKGQISLPPGMETGNYTVRAYTHWMRNFDLKDFFYMPVPVLDISSKALSDQLTADSLNESEVQLKILTARDSHGLREQMELTVEVTDEDGNPLLSTMSVSVVDTGQVAHVAAEKDIVEAYEWLEVPKEVDLPEKPGYQIEYGIALAGYFRNRKDEPEAVDLMMVQGKYENYGTIKTDSMGQFWASGLHFTDSAEISFGAVDKKGRPYGKTILNAKTFPPLPDELPLLAMNVTEKGVPQRFFSLDGKEGYTLLDEVTVKDDKFERLEERNYGYGAPDNSISGEKLENAPFGSALQAMAGMYGVRVFHSPKRIIVGRSVPGLESFGPAADKVSRDTGDPEPLIILDGQRVFSDNAAEFLDNLNTAELKKIDVYTYGATIFGTAGYSGVIMIESKKGERTKTDPTKKFYNKDGLSLYTVKGYTAAADFNAPDYSEKKESHNSPDYRSTIYWNPAVKTDSESGKASFSFFSADLATTYKVVIEGVTADHTPFREVKYVTVDQ